MQDITKIDISKLDKVKLLQCLINNANCMGMGNPVLAMTCRMLGKITYEHAQNIWKSNPIHYFDYCESRPLKIDLSGNTMNAHFYVRDNNLAALTNAISQARQKVK